MCRAGTGCAADDLRQVEKGRKGGGEDERTKGLEYGGRRGGRVEGRDEGREWGGGKAERGGRHCLPWSSTASRWIRLAESRRKQEGIVISIHGKGGRYGTGFSLSCKEICRTEVVNWRDFVKITVKTSKQSLK
jgi:hypothetical protein